jgi:Kef-type K+ transport system membrane component KefB/nucleotide-binding universal stress UspA family protein
MTSEATFIAAIVVILLASRLLGEAAQRFGQPAVIGQLAAGVLLGPSVFGLVWPQAQQAVFPHDPAQRAMLDAIAQFGVLLLLLLTGMDADVKLIRAVGRPALAISATGVLIPFVCGLSLGFMLPPEFLPDPQRRIATALFLGAALSISSIKIVAMVVREMKFARRDLGQLIMASAILEDSIGWILIAIIFGVASARAVDMGRIALSIAGVALFLAVSLTFGRRLVSVAIRLVNDSFASEFPVVTLVLVIMCGLALVTQALGVQTVLGAFIAGVLIGESPILTKHISDQLRGMVASFFAPVFFTLAGLNSDLTILGSPRIALLTAGLILIASVGKFAGAFIGGAIGGLSRAEALALAIAMNARGSTEVIVASIGLSTGALTRDLYSMIVAMAVMTTCAMPPTLRWALARAPIRPGERERLEREAFEAKGFVANMERFLMAASDHPNGRFASRLAGLMAGSRGRPATMLGVPSAGAEAAEATGAEMASAIKQGADVAREARPEEAAHTPDVPVKTRAESVEITQSVSEEAPKGYDFLVVGLDPAGMPEGGFNPDIAASARSFGGPLAVAIARGAHKRDPVGGPLRILAPITGTATSRRGAEVAIELARAGRAELTILFLSPALSAPSSVARRRRQVLTGRHEEAAIKEVVELADHRDQPARVRSRRTDDWPAAILEEADAADASLIVLGVAIRPSEALLFGETANQLLETSPRSLMFVAS